MVVTEKLHKVLAAKGLGSRRQMERLITSGEVMVNGLPATLGMRVDSTARIVVRGQPLKLNIKARPIVLAYHKPEGVICTRRDPQGRLSVFDQLPRISGERLITVGRLDLNSSGLLLITNDGELAHKLMHPSSNIEREYLCRVRGIASEKTLQSLRHGVMLDGKIARFKGVTRQAGSGGANRWYKVVLAEGRYREVRRMWAAVGLTVSRLIRIRYGPIVLPRSLQPTASVKLNARELSLLRSATRSQHQLTTKPTKP